MALLIHSHGWMMLDSRNSICANAQHRDNYSCYFSLWLVPLYIPLTACGRAVLTKNTVFSFILWRVCGPRPSVVESTENKKNWKGLNWCEDIMAFLSYLNLNRSSLIKLLWTCLYSYTSNIDTSSFVAWGWSFLQQVLKSESVSYLFLLFFKIAFAILHSWDLYINFRPAC